MRKLSIISARTLRKDETTARPIRKWSDLVWYFRNDKISEDQAEEVRQRLAKRIKAAAKGFSDADWAARYGCSVEKEKKRISENERKIKELEAMLAQLS